MGNLPGGATPVQVPVVHDRSVEEVREHAATELSRLHPVARQISEGRAFQESTQERSSSEMTATITDQPNARPTAGTRTAEPLEAS